MTNTKGRINNYLDDNDFLTEQSGNPIYFFGEHGGTIDNDTEINNTIPTDNYFKYQKYIKNTTGFDLNIEPVWDQYTGAGVKVAVLDQGIDGYNPDLAGKVDFTKGYNSSTGGIGEAWGWPIGDYDNHGTAVAGIIGAARNGQGVVGIAYGATLIPVYDSLLINGFDTRIAGALSYGAQNADVLNNSWGFGNLLFNSRNYTFIDNFLSPYYAPSGSALSAAASDGRDGLGTVVVFSAGNGRAVGDDTNLHNYQNSRFVSAVASVDFNGKISDFSTPGASILVSTFGQRGSIFTTDRVGDYGYTEEDYTPSFAGTSAAAPMVSAVAALMLEANPNLGWRDVQAILAYTARNSDATSTSWAFNGNGNWNGGGLHISHDFGFGLVDARAAVALAKSWTKQSTSDNEGMLEAASAPALTIPDAFPGGVQSQITIDGSLRVEHAEIYLDITHPNVGDLVVTLTSPKQTVAKLVNRPGGGASNQDNIQFVLSSTFFWGEDAVGTWILTVSDQAGLNVGILNNWTLSLFGEAQTINDTYIYTDEFNKAVLQQSARTTIADTDGGIDTLNFAALTSNISLDLNTGGVIATITTPIASGTVIENVVGGIGADTIWGNSASNELKGGDGADSLLGIEEKDVLYGDDGADYLHGGTGDDTLYGLNHDDMLSGGADNDLLRGGAGADWQSGADGADILFGDDGEDTLIGGNQDDQLLGGNGNDLIYGDGVNHSAKTGGNDILRGGAQNDTIYGGAGNDDIDGGSQNDFVHGGAGNDLISNLGGGMAAAGSDTIIGGTGDDTIVLRIFNWERQVISFDDILVNGVIQGVDLIKNFQSDAVDSSGLTALVKMNSANTTLSGPAFNPADQLDLGGLLDGLGYGASTAERQSSFAIKSTEDILEGYKIFELWIDTNRDAVTDTLIARIQNVTSFDPAIGTIDPYENIILL